MRVSRFLGRWRCIALMFAVPLVPAVAAPFDHGQAGFSVEIRGWTSSLHTFFATALPGEKVLVKIASREANTVYQLLFDGRSVAADASGQWQIHAPVKPGVSTLVFRRKGADADAMRITLFTLVPAVKVRDGVLNGYRIGRYPDKPYKGLDSYRPPRGYIEVTEASKALQISPHFTLGQFLCKQVSGYPKYLVLRPGLLLKLEGLLADVNKRGVRADSFVIMSGYRTPYYNAAIKNVKNSRHVWGGAADIFIDVNPVDGVMDDLNGDGRITKGDAMVLYHWADQYVRQYGREDLLGGVGAYNSTASHGPFVHIDVRGQAARWGAE